MISVIIPTYNRSRTIERAIRSVLYQTYEDLEVIVIDDNSTDCTYDIVNSIDDNRLKYIKLDSNVGANKARNIGVDNSLGEYIAFQDSDDEWLENKLEIQLKILKEKDVDLVFSSFELFNGNNKKIIPDRSIKDEEVFAELLKGNFISTQTILGKSDCFKSERFDEQMLRFQDWDLMIRIAQKYKIHYIKDVLVNVYLQYDSITQSKEKAYQSIYIMIEKYDDLICKNRKICSLWRRCAINYAPNFSDKTKSFLEAMEIDPFNIKNIVKYAISIVRHN